MQAHLKGNSQSKQVYVSAFRVHISSCILPDIHVYPGGGGTSVSPAWN